MKNITAAILALCAAATWAQEDPAPGQLTPEEEELYGGQVPIPPPFDPYSMLGDEALDAYIVHRFQEDPDALAAEAQGDGFEVPIRRSPGSTQSDEEPVVVGWVSCPDIRAHYPHKGRYSLTVKAKASGYCVFRPSGQGVPPPADLMWWTLRMSLISHERGVMAIGRFKKRGWGPRWKADTRDQRGTQVDSGRCYNGTYLNLVVVLLELPPGYSGPGLMAFRTGTAAVRNC